MTELVISPRRARREFLSLLEIRRLRAVNVVTYSSGAWNEDR